jgi:hypothetical protein
MGRAGVKPAAMEHQKDGGMRRRAGRRCDVDIHRPSFDL